MPRFDRNLCLWLALCFSAFLLLVVLSLRNAPVQAQTAPAQITIYSPQTSYSVSLLDVKGQPYIGLVEVLEPLGQLDAKPDGRKYKLRFTPPGGRPEESQFTDGKDKGKVRGEGYKLPANFVLQNGRGYVPLFCDLKFAGEAAFHSGRVSSGGTAPVRWRFSRPVYAGDAAG